MSLESVHDIVRRAETNYLTGNTTLGKYVNFSMHDTIETIDAYLNSKHISGPTDSLGREKPFFNIVAAAVNIWYRATDIDRKDIRIKADKVENTALAFITTCLLQNWMKKARFGVFLNQWGRELARYGSAVVKFVEQDGELTATVVPWNRYIADPVDFEALPRIEKFYKTPAQLRKMKNYNQDQVDKLITAITARKTLDNQQKDILSEFIELYEIHGELDERNLQDEPDLDVQDKDIKYRQQMHVISFVGQDDGKFEDFTLYKGKEKRDPYMLTHLIEEDGRTLAIGAVEYLFDAQWMTNHTVKNQKDVLDLGSKLIFQTADSNFVGRNVLSAIETGDILVHQANMGLERIANDKPDISALQNYGAMWRNLAPELTSTPDAARGTLPPSGTPLGTVQIVTSQGLSLFEQMTENKGLHIEDMLREFILPYLQTKMDTKEEIVAILQSEGLDQIDSMYVPKKAIKDYNATAKEPILNGQPMAAYNKDIAEQSVRDGLSLQGNMRSFTPDSLNEKTWKQVLADFAMDAEVEVTNEAVDKQAVLQTLSSVFQTVTLIAQNGGTMTPEQRIVFNAILTETGRISPIQLSAAGTKNAPAPAQPAQGAPAEKLPLIQ